MVLMFTLTAPVQANPLVPDTGSDQSSNEASKQDLQDLKDLLNNPEKLETFKKQIDTMLNVQEEQVQHTPILESVGVKAFFADLTVKYDELLETYNVKAGLVSGIGFSVLVILFTLIAIWIVKKIGNRIERAIQSLKKNFGIKHARLENYLKLALRLVRIGLLVLAFLTLLSVWGISAFNWLGGLGIEGVLNTFLSIAVILIFAAIIWEVISILMEVWIQSETRANRNRLRTLLPLMRNVIFIALCVLVGMVILSELGIDIVPLMAGAGVLGIAVGLGAQGMVKDFITGFGIIIEDLIHVGDVVEIGGYAGVVESITIRQIKLRDLSGTVYVIPHGEITTIKNMTKDFSYAVFNMGVAYKEDTDEVCDVMRDVGADLQKDEDFGTVILEPIEILGVDQFADSAVIIKARIKTKPIQQWRVMREYNRRLKKAFDKKGIEIPFPQQTMHFAQEAADTITGLSPTKTSQVPNKKTATKSSGAKKKPSAKKSTTKKK